MKNSRRVLVFSRSVHLSHGYDVYVRRVCLNPLAGNSSQNFDGTLALLALTQRCISVSVFYNIDTLSTGERKVPFKVLADYCLLGGVPLGARNSSIVIIGKRDLEKA